MRLSSRLIFSGLLLSLSSCSPQVFSPGQAGEPDPQPTAQLPPKISATPEPRPESPEPENSAHPQISPIAAPVFIKRAARLELNGARQSFSAIGQQEQLSLIAYNSEGQVLALADLQLSWSSSHPEIFSISPAGLTVVLTQMGSSTMRVVDAISGLTAEMVLSVSASNSGGSSSGGGSSGGSSTPTQPTPATLSPLIIFEGLEQDPA